MRLDAFSVRIVCCLGKGQGHLVLLGGETRKQVIGILGFARTMENAKLVPEQFGPLCWARVNQKQQLILFFLQATSPRRVLVAIVTISSQDAVSRGRLLDGLHRGEWEVGSASCAPKMAWLGPRREWHGVVPVSHLTVGPEVETGNSSEGFMIRQRHSSPFPTQ